MSSIPNITMDPLTPPSPLLLMLETRAFAEFASTIWSAPWLRMAPRGDGHPVLVLPGLSATDHSTWLMRAFLHERGYATHGWKLGQNTGAPGIEAKLRTRVAELTGRYGRKVSIVGWSLGGVYGREIARQAPEAVRSLIMLGSPFAGDPRANHAWPLYEWLSGRRAGDRPGQGPREPPPVPTTSIYSRSDGVVAWQCCVEGVGPLSENIEVESSHGGLGHNAAVLHAIADRLAHPEGDWRPFELTGIRRLFYQSPLGPE